MHVYVAGAGAKMQVAAEYTAPNGTTATQIVAATPAIGARQGVIVQSLSANTAKVYVGPLGVDATTGIELSPGDSVSIPVFDPSTIFATGAAASQKLHVSWI